MIIQISGYDVIIDESDYEFVMKRKWRIGKSEAARGEFYFYSDRKDPILKKYIRTSLHRYIMGCVYGDGNKVDHIDRNTFNNSRNNLRITDNTGNSRNKSIQRNCTTGYKGVHRNKCGRYYGSIRMNGAGKNIGTYNSKEECARVYDMMAIKLFGEFACTNFPIESYSLDEIEQTYIHVMRICKRKNSSGYKGVFKNKNSWEAQIHYDGKARHIGMYHTPEEAARAYDKKALELGRDKSRLNFPEEVNG